MKRIYQLVVVLKSLMANNRAKFPIVGYVNFLVRKTSLNRVGGFFNKFFSKDGLVLIIGSGILINLLTNYFQDTVEKQRYLEMLQLEIRSQTLKFLSLSQEYNKGKGVVLLKYFIDDKVYLAGLNNGFILIVEPDILSKLLAYYGSVNSYNYMLEQAYDHIEFARNNYENCILSAKSTSNLRTCEQLELIYDETNIFYSKQIFNTWTSFYSGVHDLDAVFNPTAARQRSLYLKLLMGSKSLEFLK